MSTDSFRADGFIYGMAAPDYYKFYVETEKQCHSGGAKSRLLFYSQLISNVFCVVGKRQGLFFPFLKKLFCCSNTVVCIFPLPLLPNPSQHPPPLILRPLGFVHVRIGSFKSSATFCELSQESSLEKPTGA